MNTIGPKLRERRVAMVEEQLEPRGIRDDRVLAAMAELPREQFMPADQQASAYEDRAVPIGWGQTISQPYVVALMSSELQVQPRQRVLEIGTGSGYQTAVLAHLGAEVFTIERIPELAAQARATLARLGLKHVHYRVGDGTLGWPEQAPFDRILCAAGSPEVPEAWPDQLVEGGRMILPVGGEDHQQLIRIDKQAGRLIRTELCAVRFVRLVGQGGWWEAQADEDR